MEVSVQAGASRQVVAALGSALVRLRRERCGAVLSARCDGEETQARLEAIRPVIEEHLAATKEGRQPEVAGADRLKRNVASHNFNCSFNSVREDLAELRSIQRGPRKKPAAGAGPAIRAGCGSGSKGAGAAPGQVMLFVGSAGEAVQFAERMGFGIAAQAPPLAEEAPEAAAAGCHGMDGVDLASNLEQADVIDKTKYVEVIKQARQVGSSQRPAEEDSQAYKENFEDSIKLAKVELDNKKGRAGRPVVRAKRLPAQAKLEVASFRSEGAKQQLEAHQEDHKEAKEKVEDRDSQIADKEAIAKDEVIASQVAGLNEVEANTTEPHDARSPSLHGRLEWWRLRQKGQIFLAWDLGKEI